METGKQASPQSRRKFLKQSAGAASLITVATSKGAWGQANCVSADGGLARSAAHFGSSVQCTPEITTTPTGHSLGGYKNHPSWWPTAHPQATATVGDIFSSTGLPTVLSAHSGVLVNDVFMNPGSYDGWVKQSIVAMLNAVNDTLSFSLTPIEVVDIIESYAGVTVDPISINGTTYIDGYDIIEVYFDSLFA